MFISLSIIMMANILLQSQLHIIYIILANENSPALACCDLSADAK